MVKMVLPEGKNYAWTSIKTHPIIWYYITYTAEQGLLNKTMNEWINQSIWISKTLKNSLFIIRII